MTFPTTTSTVIIHEDYNSIQVIAEDIMGLGENGYGLASIQSNPVTPGRRVKATQWNYLLNDVNSIYQHVTGEFTSTQSVTTGTTQVSSNMANNLYGTVQWLQDRRYTAHESQFLVSTGSSTVFYNNGTSLRTLPWGVGSNAITHRVVTEFENRLSARYYFNLGCYLTFTPYYEGTTGLNDLDAEWADFIDYLVDPANQYRYDRTQYITYSSTTTAWSSGTLNVSVVANRAVDQSSVEFIITYSNDASPSLLISPAVGIFNITL